MTTLAGTTARALIALAIAVAGVVVVGAAPAFACRCAVGELETQAERADAVFLGTVEEVSRTDGGRAYDYRVAVDTAWTDGVNDEVVVTSAVAPAACGLGELPTGQDYLFLASGDRPPYSANSCGGSGPGTERRQAAVASALGEGQPVEPPEPRSATRTRVADSEPRGFTRLAAPGAAMALIGLLGLVVVRRLARR